MFLFVILSIFLAKQLELLRPVLLESIAPTGKKIQVLEEFYKNASIKYVILRIICVIQVVPVAMDLDGAMFGCVASRALKYNQLIKQVVSVNWDVSELATEHSPYVDTIISVRQSPTSLIEHISIKGNCDAKRTFC